MSFSAFFAGLSGLQANASRLSVIGNNLANVNTVGFKSSRMSFGDVFSSIGGTNGAGNPMQVGRGTQVASIDPVLTQGSLQATGVLTDLSIQGKGFFVTRDSQGALIYSRAGNFVFNKDGFLVAPSGAFVQGFMARDAAGSIVTSGALADIQVPTGLTAPPQATSTFSTFINLDVGATPGDPWSTSIAIYDSLGERHTLTVEFTPVDTDGDSILEEWNYQMTLPGEEVVGGTAGVPFVVDSGVMDFDVNGQLILPAGNPTINIPGWVNGAAAQSMVWELYDAAGNGQITGYADNSAITSANQDGFGVGTVRSLTIEPDGLISGVFTNGRSLQLARVVLAVFNNANGLLRDGNNGYLETNSAGLATVGTPSFGGRGIITPNTLELSNVDITQEFTDLIISQRGYQANSRIITTTDEVIQEALSLKR